MQACVLSDHGHGPAVGLLVHTPVVENFEPQPSVSWAMARNILAKRVLPDAHIRCLCSQLCASNPI